MIDNMYILFFVMLLITLREGFQQADWFKHNPSYSTIWHTLGLLMRFMVFGLLYREGANTIELIISVVIMWPMYNIACNIGRNKKWYYLSNKGVDLLLRKLFFFINFDK